MKWTAVDLAVIGGIVDDMADPPFQSDPPLPERMRTMLDGEGVDPDDPDNPQVDAAGVTALSYAMQFGSASSGRTRKRRCGRACRSRCRTRTHGE